MLETPGNGPFYAQGLYFSCKLCSTCCRFDTGYVFLSKNDAAMLCTALNMEKTEFVDTYCHWVEGEEGEYRLSLKEKPNYDCIFWDAKRDGGCLVYETRPLQCRTFPFWSSVLSGEDGWKITAQGCPGMDQGSYYSRHDIDRMLNMRRMEPIISKNA